MNLSPHFTLEELIATQHRDIDNDPPLEIVANLKRTALLLESVRQRLGAPIIISSGYRSPALNKAVGGQPNSQHLTGQAVDFICPGFGTPTTVISALKDSGIDLDQAILEFNRWVHISWAEKPRGQYLQIDKTGTRPMWS
ncbi:MAG TPA: D-Ala-D-Ala carboxypeptidase family metallohydrolase [Roseateles sp.]